MFDSGAAVKTLPESIKGDFKKGPLILRIILLICHELKSLKINHYEIRPNVKDYGWEILVFLGKDKKYKDPEAVVDIEIICNTEEKNIQVFCQNADFDNSPIGNIGICIGDALHENLEEFGNGLFTDFM
jgi:hypothetical protein